MVDDDDDENNLKNSRIARNSRDQKRELKKKFLKPMQKAEKCSPDSFFSTEVTWTALESDKDQSCPKNVASTIIEIEYLFICVAFS